MDVTTKEMNGVQTEWPNTAAVHGRLIGLAKSFDVPPGAQAFDLTGKRCVTCQGTARAVYPCPATAASDAAWLADLGSVLEGHLPAFADGRLVLLPANLLE